MLSCRGCLLLFIASRSCFVTTVTGDQKKRKDESFFFFFFFSSRGRSVILCITAERISKNCSLARCNVQRQSGAADARFPPGYLTHDLVRISTAFSCTSAHFTHLLTADRTHCGSTAPTYCTCVTGCRPAHTHAAGAGSLEGKLNDLFFFFCLSAGACAPEAARGSGRSRCWCLFKEAGRRTGLSGSDSHARWLTPRAPSPSASNG